MFNRCEDDLLNVLIPADAGRFLPVDIADMHMSTVDRGDLVNETPVDEQFFELRKRSFRNEDPLFRIDWRTLCTTWMDDQRQREAVRTWSSEPAIEVFYALCPSSSQTNVKKVSPENSDQDEAEDQSNDPQQTPATRRRRFSLVMRSLWMKAKNAVKNATKKLKKT